MGIRKDNGGRRETKGKHNVKRFITLFIVILVTTMDITPIISYAIDTSTLQESEKEDETIEPEAELLEPESDTLGLEEDTIESVEGKEEHNKEVIKLDESELESVNVNTSSIDGEDKINKESIDEEEGMKGAEDIKTSTRMELSGNPQYVLAKDTDFSGTYNGNFRYIGTDAYVEVPHIIKGVNVTSYDSMFEGVPIKGVKSTNKNITMMSNMFRRSDSGVLDISELDTTSVTSMAYMFSGIDGGQNNIKEIIGLDKLNTSNVKNMDSMFATSNMNQLDLRNFDTSKVINMARMFYSSRATQIVGLETFNTVNVTVMDSMFASSEANELNLNNFNTKKVVNMNTMFQNSKATEITLGEEFDTSNVESMGRMFVGVQTNYIDISRFNTSKVTTMNRMFAESNLKEIDVSHFDTRKVADMTEMFARSQATKITLGNFSTVNVGYMLGMFKETNAEELDLTGFDTKKVITMRDMFYNSNTTKILFGKDFQTPNTTNMAYMFSGSKAEELDLTEFDTSKVMLMDSMFSGSKARTIKGLDKFNTVNVSDMGNMFNGSMAEELDVSNFNTTKVSNMLNMFKGTKVNALDLSSFDTTKITSMQGMFEGTSAKDLDISNFDTTNVYTMNSMFKGSNILELDLSSFDMGSVNDTEGMFEGSDAIKGLAKSKDDSDKLNKSKGIPKTLTFSPKYKVATDEDFSGTLNGYFRYVGKDEFVEIPNKIKGVNVNNYTSMFAGTAVRGVVSTNPKVTNMSYMFEGNTATSLDIRGLNTVNAIHFEGMFKDTVTNKLDFSLFSTKNIQNTSRMFENSQVLELDLGSFDLTKTFKLDNMFKGAKAVKGYARSKEDADKLNNSSNKSPTLMFTVWSVIAEQESSEWTNEAVTVDVRSNNDHYAVDYMELINGEGKNVLKDSHFDKGIGELTASSSKATVADSIYTLIPTGNNVNYTYTDIRKNLVPEETYTLSIKHKNNVPMDFRGGVNVTGYSGTMKPTDDWKVSHVTFKTTKTDVILRIYFGSGYGLATSKMDIDWVKLEKGSTPTPHTLAPEDDEVIDNKKSYQVSVNGTYIFRVTDKGGNAKTVAHTVTNIDTVNPTAELKKSTTGWTNEDVSIYVEAKDDLSGVGSIEMPDGTVQNKESVEYRATKNGKYTFKVTDKAGNSTIYTEEVTNIDRSVPRLTSSIDNKAWTRDPINIKVTSEESASGLKDIEMINSPWEGRNLVLGSDIYLNEDSQANEVGGEIKYFKHVYENNLDMLVGKDVVASLDVNIENWKSGRVGYEPSFIKEDGDKQYIRTWYGETSYGGWYGHGNKGQSDYKGRIETATRIDDKKIVRVQQRGIYNQVNTDAKFSVGRPKFEIGTKSTPWTPAPEDIPLINNSKTYPVVANGLYTFQATYNNGVTSDLSVNVTNIDREAPTIKVTGNPEDWVEEGEVVLTIKASDNLSGVSKIILPNGTEFSGTETTFKVNANKDYEFKVVDNVGNEVKHIEKVEYLMIPYNFYIFDKNSKPVYGAEFELLRDGEEYKRAVSDANGLVDFGKIPPKGSYQIRQVTAPDGVVVNPGDIEAPDVTEPVEFITYPRGTILPATGTVGMYLYPLVIGAICTGYIYSKQKRK